MSKEVKKRKKKIKKKKIIKKRSKNKSKNIKNLKLFNIDNFKQNFAVFKLVSLIGVSALCNIESHNSEKYKEEAVNNVKYQREISNLDIQFNSFCQISNYNLNFRLNTVVSRPNILIQENNYKSIRQEKENVNIKYKDVIKVLDINLPSFSGMNLSREYENIIIDISCRYGIDPEIMLTYGYQESDGNWNNNGVISSTDDYGVFQINKCNHEEIYNKFGYTSEDLLYDPIKNAEAAAYLISKIMLRSDVNTLDEVFGMYNGWTNWRNIDSSINYVNSCMEIINNYFPNYNYENNKELIIRM